VTTGDKVTTDTIKPGDVYKRLGPISREATAARPELDELPVVFVESRNIKTLALVPAWLGEWALEHAAELFASVKADRAKGS
jgi:hypothetical protein